MQLQAALLGCSQDALPALFLGRRALRTHLLRCLGKLPACLFGLRGELRAQHVGFGAHTVDLLEQFGKVQRGLDRTHDVGGKRHRYHAHDDDRRQRRQVLQQIFDRAVDEVRQDYGQCAPGQRGLQADTPLELKLVGRIVPIAHLEQGLHDDADHILEHGGDNHAGKKDGGRMPAQRQGDMQQHNRAKAIDGQHRPAQEAAVDRVALLH